MSLTSRRIDLDGPVHYLEGSGGGTSLVCVHGLGGSHVNWLAVAPRLAERRRVLVPDLAGHGFTPPASRSATVLANTRLLDRFLLAVDAAPALLVGNSMGGLIALLETAAHPERVAGLVLVNPSLPLAAGGRVDPEIARNFAAYAIPGVGKRYLRLRRERLGPEGLVAETLRYCTVDPSRVPPDVVTATVVLAEERARMPWADEAFLQAAQSILAVHAGRRSLALLRQLPAVPTLLIHGAQDRLVPLASARHAARLCPDWAFEVLDGIGHVPQLEAPDTVVDLILDWLARPDPRGHTRHASDDAGMRSAGKPGSSTPTVSKGSSP